MGSHEWEKHGTCIDFSTLRNNSKYRSIEDDRIYFEKTIDIFLTNRLDKLFKFENSFTSVDELNNLLFKKYKISKVGITCQFDKKSQKQYIREMKLRVDKNFKIIDNDSKEQTNCKTDVPVYVRRMKNIAENNSRFNKM